MLGVASLLALLAIASASVLPVKPERKVADADFIKKQKQVLDLYAGLGHSKHFKNEYASFDFSANYGNFVDEKYPKQFWEAYSRKGFLPYDAVFSLACHHTFHETMKLFDVFYFAKDFNTFYSVASWAKAHINPTMFAYAYTLALTHRPDCHNFVIPPFYEIVPNFFVPVDTLHQVYDYRMSGHKEGRFTYNNSNYEYNYHSSMFGGPLSYDNKGRSDFKVAYFREDVGLNAWFADWMVHNPAWMCAEKYGLKDFKRRGENFYYTFQQIFARYTLERLANGLPYAQILEWDKPIKFGYNPRVSYLTGHNFYVRPDYMIPSKDNSRATLKTNTFERRIWDLIDAGVVYELANKTHIDLTKENGVEILGKIIYGTVDRPSKSFYKSYYYAGMDALAYISTTGTDRSYVGNALSTPMTALRDPAFYSFVGRILLAFQHFKKQHFGPYSHDELFYQGVEIENVEVDKFLTYFDMFDYEVTNGVPVVEPKDYIDHRYVARQYRLNHKPYRFNVTVKSSVEGEGIVRVFIGPKYDSDDHLLSIEQARLSYFEIDRFPVKISSGVNVWERSSTESPIFMHDQEGFRSLYTTLNNAEAGKEQFYVQEGGKCGFPARLQLPMGWKSGKTYTLAVVVSPFDKSFAGESHEVACGGSKLYDGRAMGFPFDRPFRNYDDVHNIYFKDVEIYHKDATDFNRPTA